LVWQIEADMATIETQSNETSELLSKKVDELIAQLEDTANKRYAASPSVPATTIEDEISRRRRLQNDRIEQDIQLKRMTLKLLFIFLGVETLVIFTFSHYRQSIFFT
jgi:hypothetical protein